MTSTEELVLQCINLSKDVTKPLSRKKIRILEDLSLSISKGSTSVILGHNGAGKSTLLKSIMGFKRPDQGAIHFAGHPLQTKDRREIGYMPESDALPRKLTPLESLVYQARIFGQKISLDQIMELLKKVGLYKHRNKLNHKLSKGMGRRLAWALASFHKPTLLILDEPFSGVDPVGRVDMAAWIKELHEAGTSILICTHELDLIPEYTNEVYILNQGKLVFHSNSPLPTRDTMLPHLKPVSEDA